VFNMGVIGVFGGYAVYRLVGRLAPGDRGRVVALTLAAWTSTVMAAICCAGELAWSGTVPWGAAFPAMANVHMLIGLGEAVITTLVISAIGSVRGDLVAPEAQNLSEHRTRDMVVYGAVMIIGIVLFVSPFASRWPDGLESVASRLGFDRAIIDHPPLNTPFAGYKVPGIDSPVGATVLAGLIGTVVMFFVGLLLARIARGTAPGARPRLGAPGEGA